MTGIVTLVIALAVVPMSLELTSEVRSLIERIQALDSEVVLGSIRSIPFVGERLSILIGPILYTKDAALDLLTSHQSQVVTAFSIAAREVTTAILTFFAAVVSCYFLYRHGSTLAQHLESALVRLGGQNLVALMNTVNATVRGAAYSVILTAVAQGLLAGIGYLVAGAPIPILLGLATMVISLVPFGAPALYVPVSAFLLMSGAPWYAGVGLALWGLLVVSTVDNLLRPIFISQATQLPVVLVFVGVIGGVLAFGLLGVFIGPALIAVAHQLWLDFVRPGSQIGATVKN
jgi:predicted PurR-regulated permease PerM